jgi:hypothetical protein
MAYSNPTVNIFINESGRDDRNGTVEDNVMDSTEVRLLDFAHSSVVTPLIFHSSSTHGPIFIGIAYGNEQLITYGNGVDSRPAWRFDSLISKEAKNVLETIDLIRFHGFGSIKQPQIAVCGDQSSWKSSFLETITDFPLYRAAEPALDSPLKSFCEVRQ